MKSYVSSNTSFAPASTSVGYVIEALPDAFHCVGAGCNIKQVLIGFCILHNCRLPRYKLLDSVCPETDRRPQRLKFNRLAVLQQKMILKKRDHL